VWLTESRDARAVRQVRGGELPHWNHELDALVEHTERLPLMYTLEAHKPPR
jgi:hypothetical protein